MKNIVVILYLVSTIAFCQKKENSVIISEEIKISLNDKDKELFIDNLNKFLIEKDKDLDSSSLVDSTNYKKYKDIFDELKLIEKNDSENTSNFYKAHLVNFIKQKENCYLITLAYRALQNNEIKEKARVTLLVLKKYNGFQFLSPFEFYTANWNSTQIDNVIFHYKGTINDSIANVFVEHNKKLATLFNIEPYVINYYKSRDLQEVYQLFGIDYHIDINGEKRGCLTIENEGIFVSGTNKEEYNHDLTHFYFGLQISNEKRNWIAEEGFNINLTDYWGYATKDIYQFLRDYLFKNDVTALEIFEKNRVMMRPIPTKMPVAAVIMKKIKREYGINAVIEVTSCGNSDKDFFESIEKIAGINKNNFDKIVREELEIE